ncbi:MAG: ABC transporter ATP-binding protein [Anaerolineae bacterium]|nr:ABC transporter ATP-binding protein [Anaerolineae bacterium]
MLDADALSFSYAGRIPIFEGFNWSAAAGETWTILGPSGCGKSTLLMLVAGLLQPQKGKITVAGEVLSRPRPRTGLILQDYGLLPWATVRQNVALGFEIRRFYGPDGRHAPLDEHIEKHAAQIDYWLKRVGMDKLATAYPAQLSGGERQRTAIARTLALNPDLLLMDEPFSSLDAPTREALQTLTLTLCREQTLTVLLVTHAIEEAAFIGQRILLLGTPPQRTPRIIENPHTPDLAFRSSIAYQEICAQLRAQLAAGEQHAPEASE